MQVGFALLKVHGEQKPGKTKVMIAMQMAYENMFYFVDRYFIPRQLELATFTTIN
jgi:hypothetical protein